MDNSRQHANDVRIFHFYTKNFSEVENVIPANIQGPKKAKRPQNLTRWTVIVTACESMLNILVFEMTVLVNIRIKYPNQRAVHGAQESKKEKQERLTNKERSKKAKRLLNFFLGYRNITCVVVLLEFGASFKAFHLNLQSRKSDFTILSEQLEVLKSAVTDVQSDARIDAIAQKVKSILVPLRKVPDISKVEEQDDIEVRVGDDIEDFIRSHPSNRKRFCGKLRRRNRNSFPW